MNGLRFGVTTLLVAGMLAGCKSSTPATTTKNADGSTTNADGSVTVPAQQAQGQQQGVLNSDGSRTNPDGSVTYPPGSQVAQQERASTQQAAPATGVAPAPTPAAQAAAPAPPPPPPPPLVAPAGALVSVRITETIDTRTAEVGQRWSGVLERPVENRGEVVFARGTPVAGEVAGSKGKGRFKGAGDLVLELTDIGRDRVHSSDYEKTDKGEGKRTGAFIGGGGGLGALIGGLAGGGRGALIGGLAGAGAGTAGALTGRRDVVIPAESVVSFRLESSVRR